MLIDPLTVLAARENRFHVVVQRVGDGNGSQYAHDGRQRQNQPDHHTGKVGGRDCVEDHWEEGREGGEGGEGREGREGRGDEMAPNFERGDKI